VRIGMVCGVGWKCEGAGVGKIFQIPADVGQV